VPTAAQALVGSLGGRRCHDRRGGHRLDRVCTGVSGTLASRRPHRADIDRNGRVDIIDAFRLARHIESASPTKRKWDINGDGLVNRDDVDKVALAAVRLNKGV